LGRREGVRCHLPSGFYHHLNHGEAAINIDNIPVERPFNFEDPLLAYLS
jgi:hypothetical protein